MAKHPLKKQNNPPPKKKPPTNRFKPLICSLQPSRQSKTLFLSIIEIMLKKSGKLLYYLYACIHTITT